MLAAALTAKATVLCTSNTRDRPADVAESLGVEVLTPDQLLSRLVTEYELQMLTAHRTAVVSLKGATDESTVNALRRAGAPMTTSSGNHELRGAAFRSPGRRWSTRTSVGP